MNILEKYIKNNKKVEIGLLSKNNTIQIFQTGLYAIEKDKFILYKPKNNVVLEDNKEMKIIIYTKSGIFTFKTEIISHNSKLIEIKKPKEYKTLQRRENLREEIKVPFFFEFSDDEKKSFITQNISESGFSFYCDEIFDKSKNYSAELIFEKRKIKTKIKIVEIRENIKTNLPKYRYSMQMLSLNKNDKDYITKLCLINNIKSINF